MESILAVSLAANILQFIDFAGKVFSQTIEIHRNTLKHRDEANETDLDSLGFDFDGYLLRLSHSRPTPTVNTSLAEQEMIRICRECENFTTRIRVALPQIKKTAKKKLFEDTVWRSFVEALKTVWSEDEIRQLQQTLAAYRQQITPLLVVVLRQVHRHLYFQVPI
jgi:hypothetical protein